MKSIPLLHLAASDLHEATPKDSFPLLSWPLPNSSVKSSPPIQLSPLSLFSISLWIFLLEVTIQSLFLYGRGILQPTFISAV
jgi:hypothetical protein